MEKLCKMPILYSDLIRSINEYKSLMKQSRDAMLSLDNVQIEYNSDVTLKEIINVQKLIMLEIATIDDTLRGEKTKCLTVL